MAQSKAPQVIQAREVTPSISYQKVTRDLGQGVVEEVFERIVHTPDGLDYFPIFAIDGVPCSPEEAVVALDAGARLADPADADRVIQKLHLQAALPYRELRRYEQVVNRHFKLVNLDALARALKAAGMQPGDTYAEERLLPIEQVAEVYGVSTRTIERWDGLEIPRSLRVGGVRRWRASAITNHLHRVAS